jgi:hypothetical protein
MVAAAVIGAKEAAAMGRHDLQAGMPLQDAI